jgi:hypothetical protein
VIYKLNADSLTNSLTSYAPKLCPVDRPLKQG